MIISTPRVATARVATALVAALCLCAAPASAQDGAAHPRRLGLPRRPQAQPAQRADGQVLAHPSAQPLMVLPAGAELYFRSGQEFVQTNDRYVRPGAADGRLPFECDVTRVPGAGAVLWQVSRIPFPPFVNGADSDRQPHGLVASQVTPGTEPTFVVDVLALADELDLEAPAASAAPAVSAAPASPKDGPARGVADVARFFDALKRKGKQPVANASVGSSPASGGQLARPDALKAYFAQGHAVAFHVRGLPLASVSNPAIVGQPSNVMRACYGSAPPTDLTLYDIPNQPDALKVGLLRFQYDVWKNYATPPGCGGFKGGNGNVFEDVVDFVVDSWEWAVKTYADAKAKVVQVACAALPVPDDVVAYALDAALMAAGVPPSLPSIDGLMNQGADYLASVAVQQAGIPVGDSFAQEKMREAILAGAQAAAKAAEEAIAENDGKPCTWHTLPARLAITIRNDEDYDMYAVKVRAFTIPLLYPECLAEIPFLGRGQVMTVPVGLRMSMANKFVKSQLWEHGKYWWEAYHNEASAFVVSVAATVGTPAGQPVHRHWEWRSAPRLWNEPWTYTPLTGLPLDLLKR